MNRNQKTESLELAKDILKNNQMIIVLDYKGLQGNDMTAFRMSLKDKGADLKIIRNNLVHKAIEDSEYSYLGEFLKDQVALSYSNDPITLANLVAKFSNSNSAIKIVAGSLDGKLVDNKVIIELSKLGSVDDVRAKFIGLLKAPASKLLAVFEAFTKKENA